MNGARLNIPPGETSAFWAEFLQRFSVAGSSIFPELFMKTWLIKIRNKLVLFRRNQSCWGDLMRRGKLT